jgi:hypothetical protein
MILLEGTNVGVAHALEPAFADKRSKDCGAPSASERAEGRMPAANVRRRGVGSPNQPGLTSLSAIFILPAVSFEIA